jgi:hypothetical protein
MKPAAKRAYYARELLNYKRQQDGLPPVGLPPARGCGVKAARPPVSRRTGQFLPASYGVDQVYDWLALLLLFFFFLL